MAACVKVLAIPWLPRLVVILVGLNLIGELGLFKNRPSLTVEVGCSPAVEVSSHI